MRSPVQPSIRTSSSPSGVAGARSGIFSRSAPIWKLNGTWPMRAVSVSGDDRSAPFHTQQGSVRLTANTARGAASRTGGSVVLERQVDAVRAQLQLVAVAGLGGQQADGIVADPAQGVVAEERRESRPSCRRDVQRRFVEARSLGRGLAVEGVADLAQAQARGQGDRDLAAVGRAQGRLGLEEARCRGRRPARPAARSRRAGGAEKLVPAVLVDPASSRSRPRRSGAGRSSSHPPVGAHVLGERSGLQAQDAGRAVRPSSAAGAASKS